MIKPTQQHARQILFKVLELNRPIDIPFADEGEAISFRFMLYSARKKEKRAAAKDAGIELEKYKSRFDKLHMSLEILEDGRHAVRIIPVDSVDLEILDSETGEQLSLPFNTTAEETAKDLPTLEEIMANTPKEEGQ